MVKRCITVQPPDLNWMPLNGPPTRLGFLTLLSTLTTSAIVQCVAIYSLMVTRACCRRGADVSDRALGWTAVQSPSIVMHGPAEMPHPVDASDDHLMPMSCTQNNAVWWRQCAAAAPVPSSSGVRAQACSAEWTRMDGSEWQLALGLLSWMDANVSAWQSAVGLLS